MKLILDVNAVVFAIGVKFFVNQFDRVVLVIFLLLGSFDGVLTFYLLHVCPSFDVSDCRWGIFSCLI